MKDYSRAWPAAALLALSLAVSSCALDTSAADEPTRAEIKKQRKERQAKKERQERRERQSAKDATGKAPAPKKAPAAPSRATATTKAASPKVSLKKSEPKPVWTCWWAPTTDQDWHNDVLCGNGLATERPYLRPWDDFVEKHEIMASAEEYARERNAG